LKNEERQDYARTILNSGQTLLALLNDILDLSKVEAIEARVLEEVRNIELAIEEAYAQIKDCPDRKTAALKLKGHAWFGAAMDLYNGKEFDIKEYFLRHVLKQKFSLEQV
jgi:signal transduction histidine kinase